MLEVRESFREAGPKLYICSTPIGNLQDVTHRLIETLQQADVVAAEDTRHTRKLLSAFDIHPPRLVSYHEHNKFQREDEFLAAWAEGKSIALVSDAGTPAISDPGHEAVQLAVKHGVPVVPIPGASAVLAALVASGIAPQPFTFCGFLPRTSKQAEPILRQMQTAPGAVIYYEAPHRLKKTLQLLSEYHPNRSVCVARELTKRYETFVSGDMPDVIRYFEEQELRGEFVIIVGPGAPGAKDPADELSEEERMQRAIEEVKHHMANGATHAAAVKQVAQTHGVKRNALYQATL